MLPWLVGRHVAVAVAVAVAVRGGHCLHVLQVELEFLGKLGARLQVLVVVGKVLAYDGHGQVDHEHAGDRANGAEHHAERRLGRIVAKADGGQRRYWKPVETVDCQLRQLRLERFVYVILICLPKRFEYRMKVVLASLLILRDRATGAISTRVAARQLLRVVDERAEHDDGDADEEDEQAEDGLARLQAGNDDLEARIVVEEAKEAHDAHRAEQVPGRMRLAVRLEQEVVVDNVQIEPEYGDEVDPVEQTLEELDLARRDDVLDAELEREPRDAHVLDEVEQRGLAVAPRHRQVDHARRRRVLLGHAQAYRVALTEELTLAQVVDRRQAEREYRDDDEEERDERNGARRTRAVRVVEQLPDAQLGVGEARERLALVQIEEAQKLVVARLVLVYGHLLQRDERLLRIAVLGKRAPTARLHLVRVQAPEPMMNKYF